MRLGWPSWIGVVADDLDRQRRFYRDVLGFTELAADSDWVQFDLGGSRMLEIVRRDGRPQYDRARYQVGYVVDDIEAARNELLAKGVQPISEIEGNATDWGRWCYFQDAEGNVFELKENRSAAPDSAGAEGG
jgi:catechol 2,3-dioxygenase-like lactoylglutathione lyase family enzyme